MDRVIEEIKVTPVAGVGYDQIDLPKFNHWGIKVLGWENNSDCQKDLDTLEDFFSYKTEIDSTVMLRGKLSIIGSLCNHPDLADEQKTFTSAITCVKIIGIERYSRAMFNPLSDKTATVSVNSRVYAVITSRHHFFIIDDYGRLKNACWTDVRPLTGIS